MKLSSLVSGVTLGVSVGAFGLTGALSLRAGVEPLYAVIRAIIAFVAVIWLARAAANALDLLGPVVPRDDGYVGSADHHGGLRPSHLFGTDRDGSDGDG